MTKLERLLSYEEGTEVKLRDSGKNLITTRRVVTFICKRMSNGLDIVTVSRIKEVVDVVLLFRDTPCIHVGMTQARETESSAS